MEYRPGKCLLRYSRTKKTLSSLSKQEVQKVEKLTFLHGFGLKMALFPTFIVYVIQARKMSFTISQNEKTPFQAIKTRSSKSRKIDNFAKGLTNSFGLKMALFPTFIFYVIQAKKMSLRYSRTKRKPFYAIEIRTLKSQKIDICPKGLTHGFARKMALFPTFFWGAIYARKMSFAIFQNKKTPFQAIKTRSSKRRKTDIFPKGLTHSFRPKLAIFPTFFFLQYEPGKCLLRYSRTKKGFSRL